MLLRQGVKSKSSFTPSEDITLTFNSDRDPRRYDDRPKASSSRAIEESPRRVSSPPRSATPSGGTSYSSFKTAEERATFIKQQAERKMAERLAALGLQPPTRSNIGETIQQRMERERREKEERLRQAEEEEAQREQIRQQRLADEQIKPPSSTAPQKPPPPAPRKPKNDNQRAEEEARKQAEEEAKSEQEEVLRREQEVQEARRLELE